MGLKILNKLRTRYYRFRLRRVSEFTARIHYPLDYLNSKERAELDIKLLTLSINADYYVRTIKKYQRIFKEKLWV
jgi:hypothetical protein